MLDRTRLLVIAPPFQRLPPEGYGGIEQVVVERTRELSALGATIDVVCLEGSRLTHARRQIRCAKVRLSDFPSTGSRVLDSMRYLIHSSSVSYLRAYISVIAEDEYDLVINDAFRSEPWISLPMQFKFGWNRTINILHANGPIWTRYRPLGRLKAFRFGALNSPTHAFLREHGWQSSLLPNGIRCPGEENVLTDPEPYLVHITRIGPAKGTEQAIRIARISGLPLRIYGKIQDRAYFDRAIRTQLRTGFVDYLGVVPRQVLDEAVRHATALVFTSIFSDPHPAVLLEALRFGTPIIALMPGPFSGFYDICTSLNTVSGSSYEEVRQGIGRLRTLSRLGIAQDIRRRFSWESVIEKYYVPVLTSAE